MWVHINNLRTTETVSMVASEHPCKTCCLVSFCLIQLLTHFFVSCVIYVNADAAVNSTKADL